MDKVKGESKKTWETLKTAAGRTKQKVLQKTGKAEQTVDINYNQWKERILKHHNHMQLLNRRVAQYSDAVKAMAEAHKVLATDLQALYDESHPLTSAVKQNTEAVHQLQDRATFLSEYLKDNFLTPTSNHMGQYFEVKLRIESRTNLRVDMDKNARELQLLKEKAATPDKIQKAEAKYEESREKYEDLNESLVEDMDTLLEDSARFVDFVFAHLVDAETEFYSFASKMWQGLSPSFQNVDRKSVLNHKPVITPEDLSSYKVHSGGIFAPSTGAQLAETVGKSTTSAPAATHSAPVTSSAPAGLPVVPTKTPGTKQAVAMFDFAGSEEGELPFVANDVLTIHSMEGDWWEAELKGKRGQIPGNYVKLI